jgi:hypothetical protein
MTDGGCYAETAEQAADLARVGFVRVSLCRSRASMGGVWRGGWTELFNTSYLNMASVFVCGVTGGLLMWIGEKLKPREENQPSS